MGIAGGHAGHARKRVVTLLSFLGPLRKLLYLGSTFCFTPNFVIAGAFPSSPWARRFRIVCGLFISFIESEPGSQLMFRLSASRENKKAFAPH